MYERFQIVAGIAVAAIWGFTALGRRRPDLGWLQPFRDAFPRLSEKQRAKARRRADFYAGVKLILLAIIIPMAAAVLNVMFFSSFSATELVVVFGSSALCLGLGVAAIASSRRR
jgi:hypothetical protein